MPTVLEDPSAQAVARVYSDAFLAAAAKVGIDRALEEFRSFLNDVLAANPQFSKLLTSAMISQDKKIGVIERVVAPRGSEFFTNFLRVLARHDRLDLLPVILRESERKYELQQGKRRVQVVSAVPLTDEAVAAIRRRLQEALHFEPILETTVDPSLLGGLIIQVGDTRYDSSLRTRLNQLHVRLRQRSLHEIQLGRNRFSHPAGD